MSTSVQALRAIESSTFADLKLSCPCALTSNSLRNSVLFLFLWQTALRSLWSYRQWRIYA